MIDIKDVVSLLKQRQLELAIELAEHPARSFDEYRERVGLYRGVGDALERLLDTDKQLDDD